MARRDAALESRLAKVKADKAGITTALAGFAAQQAERRSELEKLQVRGAPDEAVGWGRVSTLPQVYMDGKAARSVPSPLFFVSDVK
jgi:hypothetical protein